MSIMGKIVIVVSFLAIGTESNLVKNSTLQQIHVLFRHGDRAPDAFSMYPTDPNLSDTWYPEGLGGLTLKGKLQEFGIGKYLRLTYDHFLGRIYTPEVMDAWSTDTNRTKMSLLATIAGLWPPAPSQVWNPLLWQPIPYNYAAQNDDKILRYPLNHCQKYADEYFQVKDNSAMQEYLGYNENLIDYINENSGLNCQTTYDLMLLYFGLYTEEQTGRKLPAWTAKVYPEFLYQSTITEYEYQTYNDGLKRAASGPLLKRIIDNAISKIDGSLVPAGRKIYLYSGHEYNLANLLGTLGLFKQHIPPYGGFFIFELHKVDYIFSVKLLYQDYTTKTPHVLQMVGCDIFCPFKKFLELTENVVPQDDEEIC